MNSSAERLELKADLPMGDDAPDLEHLILDSVDAGLIALDRERRIVCWNAWMVSASKKTCEDVRGRRLEEAFPGLHMAALLPAISAAIDSGASSLLTHALHPELFPLKTRAGRKLLHDVTVSPVGIGSAASCLIHVADVTMATRREHFLRERQNARYDAVVESAHDVILTLDAEGVIRLVNRAADQFGYSPEELIGRNATVLFDTQDAWQDMWRGVVAGEKFSKPVELVARRKDGTLSYFEVSASRWQNNSRLFVTAILRDVNERRAAEAALRTGESRYRAAAEALAELNATLEQRVEERSAKLMQAEEALRQSHKMEAIGQLTGGIAHDFNNLLQGIIGALDMVQKRLAVGRVGDVGRFVQGALDSANRAAVLTNRLLAFSRRQPVDPRALNCNQLIASIEELLRRAIGERVRMEFLPAEDLGVVRCDANQLENALLNLAINARDAMPNGGTVTIATSNLVLDAPQALIRDVAPGDYVCVTVSDTGTGMPPDVQARAFDPFFTTKPIGQGTGLGLSMIYGFVRQSQGSVRIDSAPGKGTTIEVCLPLYRGDVAQDADSPDRPEQKHAQDDEVVLVVEDDDVVRLLVVEVLNELGYRVLEAADGATGLRILQSSQRIDLLVTDVGLPDVNGRQLADGGRAKRAGLKVLFMTGYAEKAAGNAFLDSGMEIISKPFSLEALSEKIKQMIEAQAE
jgi:PAS domain S-box-containing protein